jgi:hypothetical protein
MILTGFVQAVGAGPAHAADYSTPSWFPLRGAHQIGCTKSNPGCSGYHPYWALDIAGAKNDAIRPSGAGIVAAVTSGQGGNCDPDVDHDGDGKTAINDYPLGNDCPNGTKGNNVRSTTTAPSASTCTSRR